MYEKKKKYHSKHTSRFEPEPPNYKRIGPILLQNSFRSPCTTFGGAFTSFRVTYKKPFCEESRLQNSNNLHCLKKSLLATIGCKRELDVSVERRAVVSRFGIIQFH